MKAFVLLFTVLLLASSSNAIMPFLAPGTSIDPEFKKGFNDAVHGWTYPTLRSECSQKWPNVVAKVLDFVGSLLSFNIDKVLTDLSSLIGLWSTYPRCYFFTNVPTIMGTAVFIDMVREEILKNYGREARDRFNEHLWWVNSFVFGGSTLLDLIVWIWDGLLIKSGNADQLVEGEALGSMVRFFVEIYALQDFA